MPELKIYLTERLGKGKPVFLKTIQVDAKTRPPATLEHEGTVYTWRYTHGGTREALYAAVI